MLSYRPASKPKRFTNPVAGTLTLGRGNFTSTSFVIAELFGQAEPQLQTHSFQQPLLSPCCCSADHGPDRETRERKRGLPRVRKTAQTVQLEIKKLSDTS